MTCDRMGGTLAAAKPIRFGLGDVMARAQTAAHAAVHSASLGLAGGLRQGLGLGPRSRPGQARLVRHLPGGGNLPVLPSGWWLLPMTASGAAIWLALALAALASRHPGLLP